MTDVSASTHQLTIRLFFDDDEDGDGLHHQYQTPINAQSLTKFTNTTPLLISVCDPSQNRISSTMRLVSIALPPVHGEVACCLLTQIIAFE